MRDEHGLRDALHSLEIHAPDPAELVNAAKKRAATWPHKGRLRGGRWADGTRAGDRPGRRPHPTRHKTFAAGGAAAAVIAVLAGLIGLAGRPGTRPAPPRAGSCHLPTSPPVTPHSSSSLSYSDPFAGTASHLIPPYFIALKGTRRPYPAHPNIAAVYSSATGSALATVRVPKPYRTFILVSAAADDRTFALAAQGAQPLGRRAPIAFFLLRFSAATHRARLTRITTVPAIPARASLDAFALSPDGQKLAVAWEPNNPARRCITERIQVTDLRSGAARNWASGTGSVEGDTDDPWSVSWAADSRTLAFNWYALPPARSKQATGPGTGLRELDTAVGGSIEGSSQLLLPFRGPGRRTPAGSLTDIAFLTPDGASIVGAVTDHGSAGYAVFSRAGKLRRVLGSGPVSGVDSGGPRDVLWASPTGSVLVVSSPPGHNGRVAILAHGQVTLLPPLPASVSVNLPAAAW